MAAGRSPLLRWSYLDRRHLKLVFGHRLGRDCDRTLASYLGSCRHARSSLRATIVSTVTGAAVGRTLSLTAGDRDVDKSRGRRIRDQPQSAEAAALSEQNGIGPHARLRYFDRGTERLRYSDTRERPHYPSKRTGSLVASAADRCHKQTLTGPPRNRRSDPDLPSRHGHMLRAGGTLRNPPFVSSPARRVTRGFSTGSPALRSLLLWPYQLVLNAAPR